MFYKFEPVVYLSCFLIFGLVFIFSGFGMLSLLLAGAITLLVFLIR